MAPLRGLLGPELEADAEREAPPFPDVPREEPPAPREQQVAAAEGLRRVDEKVGRFAVSRLDPRGLADAPLTKVDRERADEADEENDDRAIGEGHDAAPEIVPGRLEHVTVRAADGFP